MRLAFFVSSHRFTWQFVRIGLLQFSALPVSPPSLNKGLSYPHCPQLSAHYDDRLDGNTHVAVTDTSTGNRTVKVLRPADKLTGIEMRVRSTGTKAYVVNYSAGEGGRMAPNKRGVIGPFGSMTVDQARRRVDEILGRVAGGNDPAQDRTEVRGTMPSKAAWQPIPATRRGAMSSAATRPTAISATGSLAGAAA